MLTGRLATVISERESAVAQAARERSKAEQHVTDIRNVLEEQLALVRAELEQSRTNGREARLSAEWQPDAELRGNPTVLLREEVGIAFDRHVAKDFGSACAHLRWAVRHRWT